MIREFEPALICLMTHCGSNILVTILESKIWTFVSDNKSVYIELIFTYRFAFR